MQGTGELQRQHEAHKARLARFAEQATRHRDSKIIASMPPARALEEVFKETEDFVQDNPIAKRLPPREWAPRLLDRADSTYPEIVRIQHIVADHFAVDIYDMLKPGIGGRGTNRVSDARRVAIYFCRKRTGQSYPFLSRCFGRRDHTTIMYSVRRCEKLLATDPFAYADITACEAKL